MERDKIKAYLGFARRARKLATGVNAVKTLRGGVYLLLLDRSAAKNTRKESESLAAGFSCPLRETEGLEELTGKPNCKLAAVREENLARAVLGVLDGTL